MTTWGWPVQGEPHVTSSFSPSRKHPVTGKVQPHQGADFRAHEGAPIIAVADGTVTRDVYGAVSGNYIRIQHAGGVWSSYSHLSRRDVKVGDTVACGETIGLAGSTGSATGAHLHFEVHAPGAVDPVAFLTDRVNTAGGGTSTPAHITQEDEEMPSLEQINDVVRVAVADEVAKVLRGVEFQLDVEHLKATVRVAVLNAQITRGGFGPAALADWVADARILAGQAAELATSNQADIAALAALLRP